MNSSIRRFYSGEDDLHSLYCDLAFIPCPHCCRIGCLIKHGFLYGWDEYSYTNNKVIRGKRFFCNNRKKNNNGCGGTFSVMLATVLKHFSVSATSLWSFLQNAISIQNKLNAFRKLNTTHHTCAAYRLWKRFTHALPRIRSMLAQNEPRPCLPDSSSVQEQTMLHLKSVFKDQLCPPAAFQQRFQISFL